MDVTVVDDVDARRGGWTDASQLDSTQFCHRLPNDDDDDDDDDDAVTVTASSLHQLFDNRRRRRLLSCACNLCTPVPNEIKSHKKKGRKKERKKKLLS